MQMNEVMLSDSRNPLPDPEQSLWQLGEYAFDHQQLLLFLRGKELAAEPKVLELLRYLCNHADRYVSLQELHEQVWADRIVSDTAVRSSIKKLRHLLDDNDLSNPKYIKSVSKRGYRLVCPLQAVPSEDSNDSSLQAMPGPTIQQEHHASSASNIAPALVPEPVPLTFRSDQTGVATSAPLQIGKRWWRKSQLWLIGLLLCAMLSWLGWQQQLNSAQQAPASVVLSAFPGEKHSLAVSTDQRYIAFTGRTSTEQDNQVYVLDQQSGRISQLTQNASNALFVAFSADHRTLVYSNYEPGKSSLHLLQLDEQMQVIANRTLLDAKMQITAIYPGAEPSQMIVNMTEHSGQPAMLYQLDLATGHYQRLLGVSSADDYLYLAGYSPDKTKLAIVKVERGQHWLFILDRQTQQTLLKVEQEQAIDSLSWLDNQYLYLLDTHKVQRVNASNGEQQQVMANPDGLITALTISGKGALVMLQKQQVRANRYFSELNWPNDQPQTDMISVERTVGAMMFSADPTQKWLVQLAGGRHHLALLQTGGRQSNTLFSSEDPIELYDSNADGQVLLSVGPRLAMWSQAKQQLTYLTDPTQLVSRASFSQDQQQILFGERVAGQWELRAYQLATGQSRTLHSGYREVQPAGTEFVAADEQGNLFLLNADFSLNRPLGHRVSTAAITRWYVRDKKVIWTTFDFRFTYVHSLALDSDKYLTKTRRFYDFYPRFSVSRDNGQLLYMVVQLNPTEIKQLLPQ
ncbi:MAG: winged helix-turn-helix domain-containing protein [Rheinheimera sp.]|nr:winged helix-turn-helix domain-containing protein [Rheinheimera sp.]